MELLKMLKKYLCIDAAVQKRYADSALAFEYKALLVFMRIVQVFFPAYGLILWAVDQDRTAGDLAVLGSAFLYSLFTYLCIRCIRKNTDHWHIHIMRILYCVTTFTYLYVLAALVENVSLVIVYIVLLCTSISFIDPVEYKLLVLVTLIIPDLVFFHWIGASYRVMIYDVLDTVVVATGAVVINQFYAMDRYRIFALEHRLRCDRNIDGLTELSNKRYFQEMMEAHHTSTDLGCAVLIDLDHFKEVNDIFGHERGDDVLRETAGILKSVFRDDDSLSRIGGDEFAAFFTADVPADRMEEIVKEKIHGLFQKTPILVEQGDKTVEVTFSIGACIRRVDKAHTPQEILAEADAAMYQIKNSTRNGAFLWNGEKSTSYIYPPRAEDPEKE